MQRSKPRGLVSLDPQATSDVLSEIDPAASSAAGAERTLPVPHNRETARLYLQEVVRYGGAANGRLLEVGCGCGELLVEAAARGYDVHGVETSPDAAESAKAAVGAAAVTCGLLEHAGLADAAFDVCVCTDVIGHVRDPVAFLAHVHRLLKPDGVLLIVMPLIDSWPSRHWCEFRVEPLHHFSGATIQNVLARCGFRGVTMAGHRQVFTLDALRGRLKRHRSVGQLLAMASSLVPKRLRHYFFAAPIGAVMVLSRAAVLRRTPVVSVIVPAYNECHTVRRVIDRVLAKRLVGLDKEIIIVEGNSTDGTREAVQEYQGVAGVKIILTERPRGKGHAVRQGLERATGDFVLIQDADDEYDVDDYDALLEPLQQYREAFVLGSRHKGHWRVRKFEERALQGALINAGHVLLTTLFNRLYGQTLSDPWTMYKVFRRDCLYRMHLECNRFDFDVELAAKLIRLGFTPVEVAVTYRSRSFAEGKKIRVFRDPWTWVWACVKYRVASPLARARRPQSATRADR